MSGFWWRWGPPIAGMAAIFAISAVPDLSTLPGGMSDHAGHFVGYAILAALFVRAFASAAWAGVTPFAGWRAWTASVFYGATDEFHQRFVAGRTAALDDWMADALGAAVAVVILVIAAEGRRLEPVDAGESH